MESRSSLNISRLLKSIDVIFGPMIRNIKSELLVEAINWASEGFVVIFYRYLISQSPNISLKAINISYVLVEIGKPIYTNFLNSRIMDQLSVLKSLELQVKDGKWAHLPEGKIETKNSAVEIIISILSYHQVSA